MTTTQLTDLFKEKASLVSAQIHDMGTLEEVFQKTLDLCAVKAPLQSMMPSSPDRGDTPPPDGEGRIMAAPNLSEAEFKRLRFLCREREITLIRDGLRQYPGGIDLGLTHVDFGIAETGTLVLNSNLEETRLATMLCELHVAILPASAIRPTALGMAEELKILTAKPGSFTAFITGASRTADIERVLALGVHGPLELHIMLLTE